MRADDPYAPQSGDLTFDVESYDLDLDYRVRTNRLQGRAVINAVAVVDTRSIGLDLVGLRATRARIDGDARTAMQQGPRKLRVVPPRPLVAGEAFSIEVQYGGAPGPRRSRWGAIGWEELEDGSLVAGQPTGAPTWFPCNDRPDDRARYRIAVTTDEGYRVAATGVPSRAPADPRPHPLGVHQRPPRGHLPRGRAHRAVHRAGARSCAARASAGARMPR